MRVVPVLDLMGGEVVRGIGGRRHEYRRIVSRLTASSHPRDVALALRSNFGCRELYVADLDAILGTEPDWPTLSELQAESFDLWVDAGVRGVTRACQLAEVGIVNLIVGLETVTGPEELGEIVRLFGERIVFSLDLCHGEPLGSRSAWNGWSAGEIATEAIHHGVRRLLVLDLAQVGRGDGTGTRDLCALLQADFPEIELSAGGGVRGLADLRALRAAGVQVALVASALHDARLRRDDLEAL
jgi:phosphoribosylformimino-5-aminoimidazole carboxamide ribotide isomerase